MPCFQVVLNFRRLFYVTSRPLGAFSFFVGKTTTFILGQRHKARAAWASSFLYVLPSLNIGDKWHQKKVTTEGSMGSKSNIPIMKSYQNIQKKKQDKNEIKKRKTLQDIISKSVKNGLRGSGSIISTLNFKIMGTLRNKVQLIGHVGQEPSIKILDCGTMVARFPLATHQRFRNGNGDVRTKTHWHMLVAQGATAEFVELDVFKGMELAITGKLSSRSYQDKQGTKRYVTEIFVSGILRLGTLG